MLIGHRKEFKIKANRRFERFVRAIVKGYGPMDKSFTMLTRKYFHNIFNPILFFFHLLRPLYE